MTRQLLAPHDSRFWTAIQVVVVLVLFTMNHWVSLLRLGGDYTPFSVGENVSALVYDETHMYAVGVRRFAQSGDLPWTLDVADIEDRVRTFPILNGVFVGSIVWLLGDLEWTWMALHGVLPVLMWLLIYRMIRTFASGQLLASVGAWVTILLSFGPRNALLIGPDALIQPLEATRITGPAVTTLLLLLAVVLTAAALAQGGHMRVVVAGLICGLLFYSYYFSWTGMFAGLGALLLVSIIVRAAWTGRLFLVALIGSVTATPQVGMTLWNIVHDAPKDMMIRVGDFDRTLWTGGAIIFVAATILLVVLAMVLRRVMRRRPPDPAAALILVLAALVVGAGFGCNLHLLTGYQAQHAHYLSRVIHPAGCIMAFAAMAFVVGQFQSAAQRACGMAVSLAAVACIGLGVYRQVQVAFRTGEDHRASAARVEVARWLGQNVSPDSVVGAFDGHLVALVPVFTGTRTFVPLGNRTTVSDSEILRRYLLAAHLEGRDLKQVADELLIERQATNRLWPEPVWRHWTRRRLGPKLSTELPQMIQELDAREDLSYRILDYFLLPADQSLDRLRSVWPECEVIYSNEAWSVVDIGSYR